MRESTGNLRCAFCFVIDCFYLVLIDALIVSYFALMILWSRWIQMRQHQLGAAYIISVVCSHSASRTVVVVSHRNLVP